MLNITTLYYLYQRPIMSQEINPDRILDCIGLYCPEPVFRTRVELDRMAAGEVLEVVANDPAAEEDIKSLINRIGQEVLKISKEGDVFRFLIRKVG